MLFDQQADCLENKNLLAFQDAMIGSRAESVERRIIWKLFALIYNFADFCLLDYTIIAECVKTPLRKYSCYALNISCISMEKSKKNVYSLYK